MIQPDIKTIISFEAFETAVMHKIMEKDTSINAVLRKQYKNAQVASRDFTGAGFFTNLKVSKDAPLIMEPVDYGYGSVTAIINDVYGYGFVLFIKDGVMFCLEGYTWEDSWPEVITSYKLMA